jgi:hypothetical protein
MTTASGEYAVVRIPQACMSTLFRNTIFRPPFPPEQLLGSRTAQCQPIALFIENASFDNLIGSHRKSMSIGNSGHFHIIQKYQTKKAVGLIADNTRPPLQKHPLDERNVAIERSTLHSPTYVHVIHYLRRSFCQTLLCWVFH